MYSVYLLSIALLVFRVQAQGLQVCRMVPQQTVMFKNHVDISFPKLTEDKVKNVKFVIEQFAYIGGERLYQVRGPNGGLHLALGDSMVTTLGQRLLQSFSNKACLSGDPDSFSALFDEAKKEKNEGIFRDCPQTHSLPDDRLLCETDQVSLVSVDDAPLPQFARNQRLPLSQIPQKPIQ